MDTAARLDKQSQGARQSGIEDTFQHRSSKSQFFFKNLVLSIEGCHLLLYTLLEGLAGHTCNDPS